MIRNPDKNGPITIFTHPIDQYDDSKFVPVPIKKGNRSIQLSNLYLKIELLLNFHFLTKQSWPSVLNNHLKITLQVQPLSSMDMLFTKVKRIYRLGHVRFTRSTSLNLTTQSGAKKTGEMKFHFNWTHV